ncbi:MAG: hypothetical protein ACOYOZ_12560 [Pirellula sp.]
MGDPTLNLRIQRLDCTITIAIGDNDLSSPHHRGDRLVVATLFHEPDVLKLKTLWRVSNS